MQQIQIIEFNPIYSQEIYDFVMKIKVDELGWKSDAIDLLEIEKIYLLGRGNFWIAIDSGKIVGTIAIEDKGEGQGYLQRMYLAEEYRGTGLAQNLLDNLLEFAKNKNFKEIYLGTTPVAKRAIRFYEKSVFKRIARLPEKFKDDTNDVFFKIKI